MGRLLAKKHAGFTIVPGGLNVPVRRDSCPEVRLEDAKGPYLHLALSLLQRLVSG